MKITAVDDFMSADIDALMNTPTEVEAVKTVNDIFDEYDAELMSFDNDIPQRVGWPDPIRKRVCIK